MIDSIFLSSISKYINFKNINFLPSLFQGSIFLRNRDLFIFIYLYIFIYIYYYNYYLYFFIYLFNFNHVFTNKKKYTRVSISIYHPNVIHNCTMEKLINRDESLAIQRSLRWLGEKYWIVGKIKDRGKKIHREQSTRKKKKRKKKE